MFNGYRTREYAFQYRDLYVNDKFWEPKYRRNAEIIRDLLHQTRPRVWLDVFCGQAQYFNLVEHHDGPTCVGIDNSAQQLAAARRSLSDRADFVLADVQEVRLAELVPKAELVTLMWGAYCYLSGFEAIERMLHNIASVVLPNGVFYWEVLEPALLSDFNMSSFASLSGARVEVDDCGPNGTRWRYLDGGGVHRMFSPSLTWISNAMRSVGFEVRHLGTVQTLHQVLGICLKEREGAGDHSNG